MGAQQSNEAKPTLVYFPINGRAFAIRAALRYANFPFTDELVPFSQWKEYKSTTPLGYLPVVELPGSGYFTQTVSLIRWAGRKSNLYPNEDVAMLMCDELLEVMNEFLSKIPSSPDKEMLVKMRQEFANSVMPKYFTLFSARLQQNGGPFLLGKQISVADLFLFSLLNDLMEVNMFDHIPSDWVQVNAPTIADYYQNVLSKHPIVLAELTAQAAAQQHEEESQS